MSKWFSCQEALPKKRGYYLILNDDGANGKTVDAEVACFYISGDIIGHGLPEIEGTAEEKLLDSVIYRPIIAAKDGFYCSEIDEDNTYVCWELMPTFWTYLPKAPDGYEYNK